VKRLYLLRHAKSSWDDSSVEDRERPLAPRGRKAADQLADHLLREGVMPALVLCSSALRARQTLAGIIPALRSDVTIDIEDGLYGAGADELLARLRRLRASLASAMLIGHNPGIEELARTSLAPGGRPAGFGQGFPTAALATVDFPVQTWKAVALGSGTLVAFVTPREL
jgi:phosphohistidine phosphatase